MRMHRRLAVLGFSVMVLVATACGGDEDTPVEAGSSASTSTARTSTAAPDSTAPASTVPETTAPRPPAPRTTRPPAPAPTAAPVPEPDPGPARTAPLGVAFTIAVGESVGIAGEGLTVTYSRFVSDNRCPIGVQCITAGNATIVVDVAKSGGAPAGLTLNTTEGPESGGYLGYTVALVQLSRGPSPAASLKVS